MSLSLISSLPRRLTLGAAIASTALAVSSFAQTIVVSGDVSASDLNTSAAPLTSHPSFPWETVDTGSGMATSISGFTSISDAISTEAARLTYAFNNLELTTYSGGGPGDSLEIYTPKAGSTFTFAYDGTTIATGQVVSLTVNTNFTTGAATGLGTVNLISGGTNPAFFNEIGTLTGGTNIMDFAISSFTAVNASGDFTSTGTFSVSAVPEPSTYAAVLGLTALGFVHGRRRGPRRKSSPAPAPSQSA